MAEEEKDLKKLFKEFLTDWKEGKTKAETEKVEKVKVPEVPKEPEKEKEEKGKSFFDWLF